MEECKKGEKSVEQHRSSLTHVTCVFELLDFEYVCCLSLYVHVCPYAFVFVCVYVPIRVREFWRRRVSVSSRSMC